MKWHHQVNELIHDKNICLECLGKVFSLTLLTFAIPLSRWLVDRLIPPSGYSTLLGNILVILVLSNWIVRNNLFHYSPSLFVTKVILYLTSASVFVLLILNMQFRPVAGITGQARTLYEVIDVIVLGSIAEELVFRGMMWSLFQKLFKGGDENIPALVGTSILFGVGHLGYWVQSHWPLPSDAYIHSMSMILAGAFFGAFRLKTRSVSVPILVHMLANDIILLSQ